MAERLRQRRVRAALSAALAAFSLLGPAALSSRADPGKDDLVRARDRATGLEDELSDAVARFAEARARLDAIRARLNEVELEVRRLARRMLTKEKRAVEIARELYMGGSAVALESMLSARSMADIQDRMKYMESSGRLHRQVFERLAVDYALLDRRLDELESARSQAVAAAESAAGLQAEIRDRLEAQRGEVDRLSDAIAAAAEQAAEAPTPVAAPPPPPPAPAPSPSGGRVPDWDAIAMCESGGNWHLDGYYDGGLQFHPMTWLGYGGGQYSRYAWQSSREQQIAIAERILDGQGPGAWPNCFQWK